MIFLVVVCQLVWQPYLEIPVMLAKENNKMRNWKESTKGV
jgi:hypothetical protein